VDHIIVGHDTCVWGEGAEVRAGVGDGDHHTVWAQFHGGRGDEDEGEQGPRRRVGRDWSHGTKSEWAKYAELLGKHECMQRRPHDDPVKELDSLQAATSETGEGAISKKPTRAEAREEEPGRQRGTGADESEEEAPSRFH